MRLTRLSGKFTGFFLLLFLLTGPVNADGSDAAAVVEKLHSSLLESMQAGKNLDFNGRYEKLAPVIRNNFDTPLISQVILSRYWSELDEGSQEDFINLFNRLSISTYASRFDSYSGESFKTISSQELKKGRLLVKTEFIKKDGEIVKFDYLLHQKDGNWYIISVIANGVNDLSLKRAEYATIINEKGFTNLVGEIEKKITELANSASSGT